MIDILSVSWAENGLLTKLTNLVVVTIQFGENSIKSGMVSLANKRLHHDTCKVLKKGTKPWPTNNFSAPFNRTVALMGGPLVV